MFINLILLLFSCSLYAAQGDTTSLGDDVFRVRKGSFTYVADKLEVGDQIYPTTDNTTELGSSTLRFSNVHATTFTGSGSGITNINGAIIELPLPAGGTNYINVTNTLQSSSTFYVSSGSVQNGLHVLGSLKAENLTTRGNVGIGTTSPDALLHVFNTAGFPVIKASSTHTTSGGMLRLGNATDWGQIYSINDELRLGMSIGTAMTFKGTNVGIGTTSPSTKLHAVSQHVADRGVLSIQSTATSKTALISFWDGTTHHGYVGYSPTPDRLRISVENSIPIELLGGNVGVGTSAPAEKLDVVDGNIKTNQGIVITTFTMATGASNGYVLTSDGSGIGTWAAAGGDPDIGFTSTGPIYNSTETHPDGLTMWIVKEAITVTQYDFVIASATTDNYGFWNVSNDPAGTVASKVGDAP